MSNVFLTKQTAEAVIRIRASRNMTQIDFSRFIEMSLDAVVAWENGRNSVSKRTLQRLQPLLSESEYKFLLEAVEADKAKRKLSNFSQ